MLINLLGNAVKFTAQGSIILRISAKEESLGALRLVAEVEDTGPGIAEDELVRLFKYFEQTASGRQSQSGTGLGLAISREYARLMGGDITVSSKVGIGSIFRLEITVREGRESELKEDGRELRVIGLQPGKDSVPRILVVDDRLESRTLLGRLLEMVGFDVRVAENGLEAVQTFEQWRPSFIWMDVHMPVMDGLEATHLIKATELGKVTTVAAITAGALGREQEEILAAGCDDFIRKPYREEEIFELMAKYLSIKYVYETEKEEEVPVAVEVGLERLDTALPVDLRKELHKLFLD
ncbi:MAG: Aerobic respiration control sensor protein ArcB [Pelotomaculum sp. PtaB.Bin104]|nr:MAG: Aerobic respiration control sensor protein ArcB [Pelotomaculum sp. PtaB.Bin104]